LLVEVDRLRASAALVIAVALLAGGPQAAQAAPCPGSGDVPSTRAQLREAASAIACLVNAERESRGLASLKRDADLARAARRHSADMVRRHYFDHVSPGGEDLADRLREVGYGGSGAGWRAGENIGWGTGTRGTPASLVDAWLDSPGHRRVMLHDDYREAGVGVAAGAPVDTAGGLAGATYTLDVGAVRSR
jgi:uncharacterized protein YkwD